MISVAPSLWPVRGSTPFLCCSSWGQAPVAKETDFSNRWLLIGCILELHLICFQANSCVELWMDLSHLSYVRFMAVTVRVLCDYLSPQLGLLVLQLNWWSAFFLMCSYHAVCRLYQKRVLMQHYTCINALSVNRSSPLIIGGCQSCSCVSYWDGFGVCLKI